MSIRPNVAYVVTSFEDVSATPTTGKHHGTHALTYSANSPEYLLNLHYLCVSVFNDTFTSALFPPRLIRVLKVFDVYVTRRF
jgi:hypothetical protein